MARRFYLPTGDPAQVSPAFDAGWNNTASALRRRMGTVVKTANDAVAAATAVASAVVGDATCHRQFVSDPMSAGLVFDTSTTYKCYIQTFESAVNDNAYPVCGVRIVSYDGSTVRATLLAVGGNGSGTAPGFTEFNTSIRNIAYINGDVGINASYTTVAGDRLVLETGHDDNSGATISVTPRFGESGAAGGDLPEDETSTGTTLRPWFETSVTVTFVEPMNDDFEVTPDNTTLTPGNMSAITSTSTTVSDSGRAPAVGSFSAMQVGVGSTITQRFDFPAITEFWMRFYLQMDTLPPATQSILLFRNAAAAQGELRLTTAGAIQMRDQASSTIDTSAGNLAIDVWHRLELHWTTTRFEMRYWSDPNHHAGLNAQVEGETTLGGTISGTQVDNFAYGVVVGATWTAWFDAMRIRTDDWVGSAIPFSLAPRARHPMQPMLVR